MLVQQLTYVEADTSAASTARPLYLQERPSLGPGARVVKQPLHAKNARPKPALPR